MFLVASKKLGLDKVVLGKRGDEESGLEGLSKEQVSYLFLFFLRSDGKITEIRSL